MPSVIALRLAPNDTSFADGHFNSRTRARWQAALGEKFPSAIAVVEMPRRPGRANAEPHVIAYAFTKSAGWTKHRIPLVPISAIHSPLTIDTPAKEAAVTGWLTLEVRNPDGRVLHLEDGELLCVLDCLGELISVDFGSSDRREMPACTMQIVNGPAGIPAGSVGPFDLELGVNEDGRHVVVANVPLHKGRLVIRLANGEEPVRGSIWYGNPADNGGLRLRTLANQSHVEGWFSGASVQYRVNLRGVQVDGQFDIDTNRDPNEVQEWVIEVDR